MDTSMECVVVDAQGRQSVLTRCLLARLVSSSCSEVAHPQEPVSLSSFALPIHQLTCSSDCLHRSAPPSALRRLTASRAHGLFRGSLEGRL